MRIGIDAHIILPAREKEDPEQARFCKNIIKALLAVDKKNDYVLFFDSEMKDTREFRQKNVTIAHFPFLRYRAFLPFVYSHMMIAAYLASWRLDVFHSPGGFVPLTYMGRDIVTFHGVPKNRKEAGIFVKTRELGAKMALGRILKGADAVIVDSEKDKNNLEKRFKIPAKKIKILPFKPSKVNWKKQARGLLEIYGEVAGQKPLFIRGIRKAATIFPKRRKKIKKKS